MPEETAGTQVAEIVEGGQPPVVETPVESSDAASDATPVVDDSEALRREQKSLLDKNYALQQKLEQANEFIARATQPVVASAPAQEATDPVLQRIEPQLQKLLAKVQNEEISQEEMDERAVALYENAKTKLELEQMRYQFNAFMAHQQGERNLVTFSDSIKDGNKEVEVEIRNQLKTLGIDMTKAATFSVVPPELLKNLGVMARARAKEIISERTKTAPAGTPAAGISASDTAAPIASTTVFKTLDDVLAEKIRQFG